MASRHVPAKWLILAQPATKRRPSFADGPGFPHRCQEHKNENFRPVALHPCTLPRCLRRRRPGRQRQDLQLVRLHRSGHCADLHQGNRHPGDLRRLRQQRNPRWQADDRQIRLRHRGAVEPLHGQADPGRRAEEAGQEPAAELEEPQPGADEGAGSERPGQRARLPLPVGHYRHRLQPGEDQGSAGRQRADRFLGHLLQARIHGKAGQVRRSGAG